MSSFAQNWPAVTLALAIALVIAYLAADMVARVAQSLLRAIVEDEHVERPFVERSRRLVRLLTFILAATALSVPALSMAGVTTSFGRSPEDLIRWLLDTGLRIGLIVISAYVVVRIGSAATRRFEREMSRGTGSSLIERTKRARTLGLLLQKTLTVVVTTIAALMILRELRVDITPVLTGAGIVGIAIGFGAQTLVRDVLSGFFLILEDQVRVGDLAVINGQRGLIEEVNLRTIVLRDEVGSVIVLPNGEVKTLVNMSKDYSYYVLSITVPFDQDPDPVIAAMRDAADTLAHDPDFSGDILGPLEVYGVEGSELREMIIKSRIKTVPLKQWSIGRELRKRIARTLVERGIKLPQATPAVIG